MSSGKILVAQGGGPTAVINQSLVGVARTPASVLGSTRDKPDLKYCQSIFKVPHAHEIEHFFYIGGNDVTDAFRTHLRPLLSSDMPDAYRLRNNPVAKVLNAGSTLA
jgi:6-phosphofructokinase